MTQAVLLENSSKRKHLVENNILRILGRDTGRITGKLIQTISQFYRKNFIEKIEWMSFPGKRSSSRPDFRKN